VIYNIKNNKKSKFNFLIIFISHSFLKAQLRFSLESSSNPA